MAERALQSTDRQLAPAVAETLTNLELSEQDKAVSRLARTYAEQIDRAAGAAAQADHVLRLAVEREEDPDTLELIRALKAKLAERTAVTDLGPKLLAALVELGATPKARAAAAKGGASRGRTGGKLQALRDGRAS
ncbi:terminase small subunit [Amycolatopsis thermoflava]|uniref:terminase small subunit n=1 Tax=Amycolatopsis thermoflava TaxID=84480 RepID=UPI00364AC504